MLVVFGGGEILDIAIPTLVSLVFLLYLAFPCLCNDTIFYLVMHITGTPEGGERAFKVTT